MFTAYPIQHSLAHKGSIRPLAQCRYPYLVDEVCPGWFGRYRHEKLGEMSLPCHVTLTVKRIKLWILSIMVFISLFLANLIVLNCFPEYLETPQQAIVLLLHAKLRRISMVRIVGWSTCFSLLNLLRWMDLAYWRESELQALFLSVNWRAAVETFLCCPML